MTSTPPKPTSRPRPGGGFSQGMGQFTDEYLEESDMQQAMGQKSLTQQQADPATMAAAAAGQKQQHQAAQSGAMPQPPREIGSIKDELITRPIHDIWTEIKKFFSLNTWLGINPDTQDPQKQQKMAAIHKRYQQLDAEQQEVAKKQYHEKLQKKKAEEEEKQRRKQQEEQQKQQSIAMPHSPQKGPIGPSSGKSRKSNTADLLEQDRKTMSTVQGAN